MGLLANAVTVTGATPTATTTANAINHAGPIMDYIGMCKSLQLQLKEAKTTVALLKSVTDSGDPILTTLNIMDTAL